MKKAKSLCQFGHALTHRGRQRSAYQHLRSFIANHPVTCTSMHIDTNLSQSLIAAVRHTHVQQHMAWSLLRIINNVQLTGDQLAQASAKALADASGQYGHPFPLHSGHEGHGAGGVGGLCCGGG